MKILILAGGGGTRLWPKSRGSAPKQLQSILRDQSLLRSTVEHVRTRWWPHEIYVATGREQETAVRSALPELDAHQFIIEPCRRDTAAGIALATAIITGRHGDEIVAVVSSDHAINDIAGYTNALAQAGDFIVENRGALVLLGATPAYPETGYGYIEIGEQSGERAIHPVKRFVEKPDKETARRYVDGNQHLWNTGMFIARAKTITTWFAAHLPRMHEHVQATVANAQHANEHFSAIEPISFDYGIVEKITDRYVIPIDIGWSDVGNWKTVHELLADSAHATVARSPHAHIDSIGNYVESVSGKMIATIGVRDMIIVETDDAILVCPRERAQDVKKLVDSLDEKHQ
jgi:mannose-1-phosphate guanylyltransferase